jgi:hypothetical protein
VGGRVGVRNPNDSVITGIQAVIYYSAFQLYKIPENWTRSVCCISGCLFAIRRELLLDIEPAIRARHWFGIPVNQGEDRWPPPNFFFKSKPRMQLSESAACTSISQEITK